MSRLPVTESAKVHKVSATFTSVTTERNRVISWDSTVQELTKSGAVTPSFKSSNSFRPIGFLSKIAESFFAYLAKLPYALFKIGYGIAKLVTMGLSNIRRLLFLTK
jgi:hypothetical protein